MDRLRASTVATVGVIVLPALYQVLLLTVVPRSVEIPINLGVALSCVLLARAAGASWEDLGLAPDRVPSGLLCGASVGGITVIVILGLAVIPLTREIVQAAPGVSRAGHSLLYEVLLRIPLGTAIFEELIFRSAILGALSVRLRAPRPIIFTSVLFGLWHVAPTVLSVATDRSVVLPGWEIAAAVVGVVIATALTGIALTWLRNRSGSVLAPAVVHATVNASAYIAVSLLR